MLKISNGMFDWSGVNSNDKNPVYFSNMNLLDYFGKPRISMKDFLAGSTMTAVEFLRKHGVTEGTDQELFEMYRKFYQSEVEKGNKPVVYNDVEETLKFLYDKGIKLSVISSHPEENLRREAKEYGIYDYFELIKGNSKNKAEDIKTICKQLGKDASCSVYVDDTIWGIRAAKSAGVLSAGITTGYHTLEMLKQENPDFILSKFSDLRSIV